MFGTLLNADLISEPLAALSVSGLCLYVFGGVCCHPPQRPPALLSFLCTEYDGTVPADLDVMSSAALPVTFENEPKATDSGPFLMQAMSIEYYNVITLHS